MTENQNDEYLLGTNRAELERLRFQHEVWGGLTRDFFRRIGVRRGWKCLDAGAGPGFVTMDLREMVGDEGEVTVLEQSEYYVEHCRAECQKRGWKNVRFINAKVEEAELSPSAYDLVFSRWVISFAPDPDRFLSPLIEALKPGGTIALQDYFYEGIAVYPKGGAFDDVPEVVIRYYRSEGGDPYVTGVIPAIFKKHGVALAEFAPHCLAGGPESGVMEWAHRFFTMHIPMMIERGAVDRQKGEEILADWLAHKSNPEALFFSPLVVDVAGRRLPGA